MSGRLTVLLIDGNGKTTTIRWFKGLMILFLMLLAMSVTTAAGFYFLFDESRHEVRYLRKKLTAQNGLPRELEKKMLPLPGLLMTESPGVDIPLLSDDPKNSENAGESGDVKGHEVPAADDTIVQAASGIGSGDEVQKANGKNAENPDVEPDAADPKAKGAFEEKKALPDPGPAVIQSEMPRRVDIKNFETGHDPRQKILRVSFEVTNVSQSGDRVSGHVILIMKKDENNPAGWLVLPRVNVANGRPDGKNRGKSFTISYYKKMRFKLAKQRNPNSFRLATVYVFSNNGRLMLEKQFPVKPE